MRVEVVDSQSVPLPGQDVKAPLLDGMVVHADLDLTLGDDALDRLSFVAEPRPIHALPTRYFVNTYDNPHIDAWRVRRIRPNLARCEHLANPDHHLDVRISDRFAQKVASTPIVEGLADELWRKNRLFSDIVVDFVPDPGQPPRDHQFELPLMSLHCPKHAGCEAEETAGVEKGEQIDASIAILGINAEAATVTKVKIEPGWSTKDGQCLQVVLPAVLRLEFGHTRVNGRPVAYGIRLSVAEVPRGVRNQTEVPDPHRCNAPLDAVPPDSWLMASPLQVSSGQSSITFHVATEVTGKLGIGLKLFDELVELGMSYSRTLTRELTRSYKLTSGATYLAYGADNTNRRPDLASELYWAATTA